MLLVKRFSFPSVLNMLVILIMLLIAKLSCGQTLKSRTALRFGQTTADYIQLPDGIMDNSTTKFSLCTWIRKRLTGSQYPAVLHNSGNFMLGDNGYFNYVAGTNLDLQSKYNRTLGTWFHVCMTWSNEDRRFRVYLDGHLIGTSNVTEKSELERGRKMCLGNISLRKYSTSRFVFGGDLFKLNIYNRVLTEEEIKNMAADICSREEEKLASIKVLSWADILQYRRSGNVSDINVCITDQRKLHNSEDKFAESRNKTSYLEEKLTEALGRLTELSNKTSYLEEKMNEVLGRLQDSEEELRESRNKTTYLEEKLIEVLGRLQNSEEELTESRNKTSYLEEKMNEVLGRLNNSGVELTGPQNKAALQLWVDEA